MSEEGASSGDETSDYSGLEDTDDGSDSEASENDLSKDSEAQDSFDNSDVEEFREYDSDNSQSSSNNLKLKNGKTSDLQSHKVAGIKEKSGGLKSRVGLQKNLQKSLLQEEEAKEEVYAEDSSDEEDIRNTVGNIPMKWYDDYEHMGYNLDGYKLLKPVKPDELDKFLNKMENPDFWRTVVDKLTGQNVILSDSDLKLINNIQKGRIPDGEYDMYQPWIDFFTYEVEQMPITSHPPHKRSFIPSLHEKEKVSRMVHAIKMGQMKVGGSKDLKKKEPQFYLLWKDNETAEVMRRIHNHLPAPKQSLPGHAESYNPPPEYLFTDEEQQRWKALAETPWKRKLPFIPQSFSSLRAVPVYENFVRERYERCLDLYICPRKRKMRLTIEAEDLVPKLPKPKDLQPFPTTLSLTYEGHVDLVRTISLDPSGQFMASGSDDGCVKIWEVSTGRCLRTVDLEGVVKSVAWCPNTAISLIAAVADHHCYLINPQVGDKLINNSTDLVLKDAVPSQDYDVPEKIRAIIEWQKADDLAWQKGIRLVLKHFKPLGQVTWHSKGDYFATVVPGGLNRSVLIHQLTKQHSQLPFTRIKGLVQKVLFHPIRPYLFVATQQHVRVYNLVKQELTKKLVTGAKWISSLAIHPAGDNVIVGTYDKRLQWFDLDLSTNPYQVLRHHRQAIRSVAFHKRYPLFASGSDDGSVIVCHGMVYSDLLQNPLIVPVKILKAHKVIEDLGVFDCAFHPHQPWVFSSGADHTIRFYLLKN